jgi:hypothetical protein
MRWNARVATTSHLLANGVRTNTLSIASTQGCCHCNVTAAPCYARALPSLYHCAEPSPPSLPPCAGPRCPHAMRSYKRGPSRSFCLRPQHCLPLVSRPGLASPMFLPLCRCQASSRTFHPRVQVLEHPPTSEKLPEAWPTSPTTGATRHRRCAPVRSATASPSYSDALPPAFSCWPVRALATMPWGSTFLSSGH